MSNDLSLTNTTIGYQSKPPIQMPSSGISDVPDAAFSLWGSVCNFGAANAVELLARFEDYASKEYLLGSPRTDLLLTLIKFNVLRALMENNSSLGFPLDWLETDSISPFYWLREASHAEMSKYPDGLKPTILQQTVEHHPWIDLFPFSQMRDNILQMGDAFDDIRLCHDLVEIHQCPGDWSGLIVWGDPWDPYSWEVSEQFLKKWSWVVQGCWKLFDSTNWRTKRGERKLFSEGLCTPPVPMIDAREPGASDVSIVSIFE